MLELYRNIKKYRIAAQMTQEELARKTGYTDRSSIAKIEKGAVDLTQTKIKQFAEALGTTPSVLMGWVDEKTGEKNSAIAGATKRMMSDSRFYDVVIKLDKLSPEKFTHVEQLILMIGEE